MQQAAAKVGAARMNEILGTVSSSDSGDADIMPSTTPVKDKKAHKSRKKKSSKDSLGNAPPLSEEATILAKCLSALHPLPRPRGRASVRDGCTSFGVRLALGMAIFCSFWVLIKFLAFARICRDSANVTAIPTTKAFFPAQIYWSFILSMICCSSSALNPSFADLWPQKIRHAVGLRTAMSEISSIALSIWSLINSSFHT